MSEHKWIYVLNQQRIDKVLSKGKIMKISRILILVFAVAFVTVLTGCVAQDSGAETKLVGWDENGPYFLKHNTYGSQWLAGKEVAEINALFNNTTQRQHQLVFVEKLAEGKKPVVKNPNDVTQIMDSLQRMGF